MTCAYAILPFFRHERPRDIYDCVPSHLYSTWEKAVEVADATANKYNTNWKAYVSEYIRRYPGASYESAYAHAGRTGVQHMVSRVDDRSRVECLEFGTYLAYYDESAVARRASRISKLKLLVFLLFLISAGGWYSIGYHQLAGFLVACGINVSLFMIDSYAATPREKAEGIWIARVEVEPGCFAG